MNSQIEKLALECGAWHQVYESKRFMHDHNFDIEKFAELIVRECITIVDEQKECLHEEQKYWHDRDYGYALAVNDASKGIKQFF